MFFRAAFTGISFSILLLNCAMAQLSFDDAIRIPEVAIYSTYRQFHSIGTNMVRIDTLKIKNFDGRNLADLLQSTGINIRTYGVGGLSTVALRGGNSSHTAIIWNGINLQSPMNGGVNLSQLPVSLFKNVTVQHGGIGTIYGSGAVSGMIVLESEKLFIQPNGFSVGLLYGDGNTRGASMGAKIGSSKMALSLKYTRNWADNNFEFINTYRYGNPRERITNAQAQFNGIMLDATLRHAHQLSWNISGWFSNNNKNLQTLMSSTQPSQSNQIDGNYALNSNLTHENSFFSVKIKNAWVKGDNRFNDPTSNISSLNHFNQLINEIELKKPLGKLFETIIGVGYTHDKATSDSYTQNAQRNRFLGFISVINHFINDKFTLAVSARDELIDASFIPAVFSTGAEFQVMNILKLKASAANSYRLPTMNDLYWANTTYATGNPNLNPEYGWNADIGFDIGFSTEELIFSISSTIFISEINNWIVWLPDANDFGRWKPNNFNRGQSKGLESFMKFNFGNSRFKVFTDLSYTYVDSKLFDLGDNSGKPMIYTPHHRIGGTLSIAYHGFSINYNHSFASERYTDEQNKLPYYNIGDAALAYRFPFAGCMGNASVGINNIWNEQYQLMRNYAMPLRNFFVRLNIEINSKSTKN